MLSRQHSKSVGHVSDGMIQVSEVSTIHHNDLQEYLILQEMMQILLGIFYAQCLA